MIRLTLEREKRKLSRAELARRAKMGAGDVGKIENGRAKPYRKQLVKLGRAMRMRLAEALTLADEIDATGAKLDALAAGAKLDAQKLEGEIPCSKRCSKCGATLTHVQAPEHDAIPLCDACFFEHGAPHE